MRWRTDWNTCETSDTVAIGVLVIGSAGPTPQGAATGTIAGVALAALERFGAEGAVAGGDVSFECRFLPDVVFWVFAAAGDGDGVVE